MGAQLSPALCSWLEAEFVLEALPVRDLGLLPAEDQEIFLAARRKADVVVTKDRDFVELVHRLGPPPKVIWITTGNTSSESLRRILSRTLAEGSTLLESGEVLVEIQSPT